MELKAALWLCLIWIVLILILMIFLLRKYTFGNWDKDNPNPYEKETMGLPRGLLRGILTLSVLFIVMILQISALYVKPMDMGLLSGLFKSGGLASNASLDTILNKLLLPEERFAQLMTAFQMIIAFYFGGKVFHHVTQAERDVAKTQAVEAADEQIEKAKINAAQSFGEGEAVG
ncbi:MAG: hypothetical protein P8X42_16100 [Calditrichaceae bacterium]